ncbi:MAG: hypothetical protein IH621_13475 [Krumholzibacteria bacterium]|nr:hypothetical protein [Candidatus Krumholzibacteria bacterium]
MKGGESRGLGHGRDWSVLPAEGAAYEWTIDPQQGLVQGPLDLEFLRGQRVALHLEPGQIALLVRGRSLQAVFLDGGHILDIGDGDGQIPPDCRLVFVAQTRSLDASWTRDDPLDAGDGVAVIGSCTLAISGPGRFFETFLAGLEAWDEPFLLRLVRQAVQAAVAGMLEGGEADPLRLQARLTALDPAELDDELGPCGLACVRAAFYTATPPVGSGRAADAGQFTSVRRD